MSTKILLYCSSLIVFLPHPQQRPDHWKTPIWERSRGRHRASASSRECTAFTMVHTHTHAQHCTPNSCNLTLCFFFFQICALMPQMQRRKKRIDNKSLLRPEDECCLCVLCSFLFNFCTTFELTNSRLIGEGGPFLTMFHHSRVQINTAF